MRLLYTGFEAFGEHAYNPAWDVADAAASRSSAELEAEAERMPVEFDAVRARAEEWLQATRPAGILQFGLGETRSTIDLESTARNVRGCRSDEAGRATDEPRPLAEGAPAELTSTAPVEALRAALERRIAGLELPDVSVSDDAGTYVCNALYYHTLQIARLADLERPPFILFVHVPSLERDEARQLGRRFSEAVEDVLRERPAGEA